MDNLYFEFGNEEEITAELTKHNEELKIKGVRLSTMEEIELFLSNEDN